MTDCDSCQNSGLIRKQRKELILLTNELKIQEDQINTLHSTNIKLKEEIKQREKKEFELEKKNRVLSTELKAINETLKLKAEEIESLKQKLLPKDAYIQSQSNRIFQLQTTNEKSNQEINAILRNKSELKLENSKLNTKIKEQSSRLLELKEQNDEIIKILESRNILIKTSSDHIKILENNLLEFIKLAKSAKNSNDIVIDTDQIKSQSIRQEENEQSFPKVLNNSNELKLISVLQSLKETWLESNLKYEEVKNIVFTKLKDTSGSSSEKKTRDPNVELENISRIFTSSPINGNV